MERITFYGLFDPDYVTYANSILECANFPQRFNVLEEDIVLEHNKGVQNVCAYTKTYDEHTVVCYQDGNYKIEG